MVIGYDEIEAAALSVRDLLGAARAVVDRDDQRGSPRVHRVYGFVRQAVALFKAVGENRTQVRLVDVTSDEYAVGRAYQIRLERSDLDDQVTLARLVAEAQMSPNEFKTRYLRAATRLCEMGDCTEPNEAGGSA